MADASSYNPGTTDDDGAGFSAPQLIPDNQAHTQEFDGTFYVPPVRQRAGWNIPYANNPPTRFTKKPTEGRGFYPVPGQISSIIPNRRRRPR
jgi:hypothetical protein